MCSESGSVISQEYHEVEVTVTGSSGRLVVRDSATPAHIFAHIFWMNSTIALNFFFFFLKKKKE